MRYLCVSLGLGMALTNAFGVGCSTEESTHSSAPMVMVPTEAPGSAAPPAAGNGASDSPLEMGPAAGGPTASAPIAGQGQPAPNPVDSGEAPGPMMEGVDGPDGGPPPAPGMDGALTDGSVPMEPDSGGDLAPIEPPVADDCITDVSAGDHTFTCQGITYLTMVDPQCTERACGLIVDVHGATMSGEIMRMNNRLHELASPRGYIAVAPTASGGVWDFRRDSPAIADFVERMIAAFHLNARRIHVTGFSMGSGVTFWFLCNRPDLIASAGPVTGASADQITLQDTGASCIDALDSDWQPRVPILFMSGTSDTALTIAAARRRTEGIVMRLGLSGEEQIDGDGQWRRTRWTGDGGMVFDFLEHDYSGAVGGHCIPGPTPDPIYGCTSGNVTLDWGETVLQWFIDHPKPATARAVVGSR